jgi:hypothetical protein
MYIKTSAILADTHPYLAAEDLCEACEKSLRHRGPVRYLGLSDCLAGDAVLIAPVSPREFPANREFYREFAILTAWEPISLAGCGTSGYR